MSFGRAQASYGTFGDHGSDEHASLDGATVNIIYWPPGYTNRNQQFVEGSITSAACRYLSCGAYAVSPGHIAIQVVEADGHEYYLSVGPDKSPDEQKKLSQKLSVGRAAYETEFLNDAEAFAEVGRAPFIKTVDFVDPIKVKNFIVKFNGINGCLTHLENAIKSLEHIKGSDVRSFLEQAQQSYRDAKSGIDAALLAATAMHADGKISRDEWENILRLKEYCDAHMDEIGNSTDIARLIDVLNGGVKLAEKAAGKDAFYSLTADIKAWGNNCVSIASEAVCYGDIDKRFSGDIGSLRTPLTPQVFFDLAPGEPKRLAGVLSRYSVDGGSQVGDGGSRLGDDDSRLGDGGSSRGHLSNRS